jgi:parvulin-like peptidyl-prolyl isomerase
MKPIRIAFCVPVILAVIVAAACGGGSAQSVPADAVAVVDGTPVTTADLEALLGRAKKSYTSQKRAFPKAGTVEYQSLQTQAVAFLVQRAEYDKKADELKLAVTDKEIQARLAQIKKQYFGNSDKTLAKQLKAQGYTTPTFLADIKEQLLSEKIYDSVTKSATVTASQIAAYYTQNKSQYVVAESRNVRHILVLKKAKADKIYAELKGGADFAALAKKNSIDPGSKDIGGKYTVIKGQTVPPFEKAVFRLKTNEISHPVKTQYGYHVIQALSPIKPAKKTALKAVTAQIKAQLEQKAKTDAITKWTADTKKAFASKVAYATGFAPPAAATDTTPTTTG